MPPMTEDWVFAVCHNELTVTPLAAMFAVGVPVPQAKMASSPFVQRPGAVVPGMALVDQPFVMPASLTTVPVVKPLVASQSNQSCVAARTDCVKAAAMAMTAERNAPSSELNVWCIDYKRIVRSPSGFRNSIQKKLTDD